VPVPRRLPVRCVPYNGPGVLPGWLRDAPRRPRVCVSWSTTTAVPGMQSPADSKVPAMLRVLAELDVEAVVTVRDGAAFAREHGGAARAVENLPLNLLLPTCDAIIHHGGAGTMLTAAYHGVPQVIVAPVPDQSFNADLLADTGAGVSLKAESADAGDIESGVAKVLFDDLMREAAAQLRQEMLAQPTPAQVVSTLEETT
jgi:UDP:flavonoid glycosyltransferase YjiC (YdhE family)